MDRQETSLDKDVRITALRDVRNAAASGEPSPSDPLGHTKAEVLKEVGLKERKHEPGQPVSPELAPELAARLAQAQIALRLLVAELPGKVDVPAVWDGSLSNHNGISHSPDRVMVYGMPGDPPPPTDKAYSSFYYNRQSELRYVIWHVPGEASKVTDQILYREGKAIARVSYGDKDWTYVDYVHYRGGSTVISCRILRDGSIVLAKEITLSRMTKS